MQDVDAAQFTAQAREKNDPNIQPFLKNRATNENFRLAEENRRLSDDMQANDFDDVAGNSCRQNSAINSGLDPRQNNIEISDVRSRALSEEEMARAEALPPPLSRKQEMQMLLIQIDQEDDKGKLREIFLQLLREGTTVEYFSKTNGNTWVTAKVKDVCQETGKFTTDLMPNRYLSLKNKDKIRLHESEFEAAEQDLREEESVGSGQTPRSVSEAIKDEEEIKDEDVIKEEVSFEEESKDGWEEKKFDSPLQDFADPPDLPDQCIASETYNLAAKKPEDFEISQRKRSRDWWQASEEVDKKPRKIDAIAPSRNDTNFTSTNASSTRNDRADGKNKKVNNGARRRQEEQNRGGKRSRSRSRDRKRSESKSGHGKKGKGSNVYDKSSKGKKGKGKDDEKGNKGKKGKDDEKGGKGKVTIFSFFIETMFQMNNSCYTFKDLNIF